MPVRVICDGCGYILAETLDFDEFAYKCTLTEYVRKQNEGRCPSCRRKLSLDPISINVKPYKKWGSGKEEFFGWKLRRRK